MSENGTGATENLQVIESSKPLAPTREEIAVLGATQRLGFPPDPHDELGGLEAFLDVLPASYRVVMDKDLHLQPDECFRSGKRRKFRFRKTPPAGGKSPFVFRHVHGFERDLSAYHAAGNAFLPGARKIFL